MSIGTALIVIFAVCFACYYRLGKLVAILAVIGALGVGTILYLGELDNRRRQEIRECAENVSGPEPSLHPGDVWDAWYQKNRKATIACSYIADGKRPPDNVLP